MMLFGAHDGGGLEVRRSGGETQLSGSFPYGSRAILSDGGRTGRPQKEVIESKAFSYRVESEDGDSDIHLLVGHDYSMPLASKASGTLKLRDTDAALIFDAIIGREIVETTHARDALALISAGLAVGISPGFRIPPKRAVAEAEWIEQEPDEGPGSENRGAIIRHVKHALLYELSIVTRPAYSEAQIQRRNWTPDASGLLTPDRRHALRRWRA